MSRGVNANRLSMLCFDSKSLATSSRHSMEPERHIAAERAGAMHMAGFLQIRGHIERRKASLVKIEAVVNTYCAD